MEFYNWMDEKMIWIVLILIWFGCGFLAVYLNNKYCFPNLTRQEVFTSSFSGICSLIAILIEIIFNRDWWLEEAFVEKNKRK